MFFKMIFALALFSLVWFGLAFGYYRSKLYLTKSFVGFLCFVSLGLGPTIGVGLLLTVSWLLNYEPSFLGWFVAPAVIGPIVALEAGHHYGKLWRSRQS